VSRLAVVLPFRGPSLALGRAGGVRIV